VRHSRHLRLGRREVVTLVAFVTALGLLWAVGRAVDRSHAAASDSQLAADLQVARATLAGDLAAASRQASALARLTSLEQALAQGDAQALEAVAAVHRGALLIAANGARGGSLAPLGVTRSADVVAGGRRIGTVVTEEPATLAALWVEVVVGAAVVVVGAVVVVTSGVIAGVTAVVVVEGEATVKQAPPALRFSLPPASLPPVSLA